MLRVNNIWQFFNILHYLWHTDDSTDVYAAVADKNSNAGFLTRYVSL